MPSSPFCFAISSSFTAEPIRPVIEFWGRRLDSDIELCFAPYNQPLQTLLDPHSVFSRNQHGINVLLVRLEDLGSAGNVEARAFELIQVVRDALPRFRVPLILCLTPDSPEFLADVRALRARIVESLGGMAGLHYLAAEEVSRRYPVETVHDASAQRLGRIPYSETYFCALGTALVRRTHALFLPPYKLIALDCDNTLWQGICGEDGPWGIVVDPPRRALQEFMLAEREAGMLLALNSKNNQQDVLETFAANPDMPLELRHFAAWRLNWEPKEENLAAIAAELGLGLDSFIFVDDNPKECAEVADNLPEVLALPLPEDIRQVPEFLKHVWAFDHPVATAEDRNRNAHYSATRDFGREIKRAANLEEFMAGLHLEVAIAPLSPDLLSRAAQLTQRTNQFNLTTLRRSEADIQALAAEGFECVTADVKDRFGGYGVTGLMIYRADAAALAVDTFLLSCRVLGRGVEHRLLAWLGAEALRRGLPFVVVRLTPTARNAPARQFLHSVGADVETATEAGFTYRFDAARLRDLRWTPVAPVETTAKRLPKPAPAARRSVDYAAIATELATPGQILAAMRLESRPAGQPAGHGPLTEVERQLADIWSELLKHPGIQATDNFFDLGGHSLLVVLLILRVREVFAIELPIDDVYSATLTLGELARKIEAYQSGQMNPDEYEALLAEIEGLSDEEVQALLEKEDPGVTQA